MAEVTKYRSREGHLTCTPSEIFKFVTDMRNFKRFVPQGSVEDLIFGPESCSFKVAPVGSINIDLAEKKEFSKVAYNGNLLRTQDFSLVLDIKESLNHKAEVFLTITAGLNPLLKMMAEKYIHKFLEVIIDEMEKFRDWEKL